MLHHTDDTTDYQDTDIEEEEASEDEILGNFPSDCAQEALVDARPSNCQDDGEIGGNGQEPVVLSSPKGIEIVVLQEEERVSSDLETQGAATWTPLREHEEDGDSIAGSFHSFLTDVLGIDKPVLMDNWEDELKLVDNAMKPVFKLEVLKRRTFHIMIFCILLSFTYALVGIISISLVYEDHVNNCNLESQNPLVYYMGLGYTIGVISLLFLLIAFPQRVIVYAVGKGKGLEPQQLVCIILIVLLNVIPLFSVYRSVLYWIDVTLAFERAAAANVCFALAYFSLSASGGSQMDSYGGQTIVMSVFLFFYSYNMSILEWNTKAIILKDTTGPSVVQIEKQQELDDEEAEEQMEEAVQNEAKGGFFLEEQDAKNKQKQIKQSKRRLHDSDDDGTDDLTDAHESSTSFCPWFRLATSCCDRIGRDLNHCFVDLGGLCLFYYMCGCFLCFGKNGRQRCADSTSNLGVIRRGLMWNFLLLLIVYILSAILIENLLDCDVSVVPVVQLITIIRVCATADDNQVSYCNKDVYPSGYQRAWANAYLVVLEIIILATTLRISSRTFRTLRKVPYQRNRPNFLSYLYWQITGTLVGTFIFLYCVLELSIPAISPWVFKITYNETDQTMSSTADPLFTVGVTARNPGFSLLYLVVMVWLVVITTTLLPPDSCGIGGWFVGNEEMGVSIDQGSSEQPIYFPRESMFPILCEMKRANQEKESFSSSPPLEAVWENPLLQQVRSNTLCLETELNCFNVAMASYAFDPKAFVEESTNRYEFIAHVNSEETDTHAIVVRDEQSIVIAFRGTASGANMKTDMDFSLKGVLPDIEKIQVENVGNDPIAKMHLQNPPLVHFGFSRAYDSVKEELHRVVDPLLFSNGIDEEMNPRVQRKALFVTGHSLGGALAVLGACDFAMLMRRDDEQAAILTLACTTFGCPRVGNYSFKARAEYLVPRVKRFVLARDIIPTLKPPLFNKFEHVGLEVLLDLHGNALFSPTFIERSMFTGFRTPIQRMHYMTRYCLALHLWSVRRHGIFFKHNIWVTHLNRMIEFAMNDINAQEKQFTKDIFLFYEGVVFGNKSTRSTQTTITQTNTHATQTYF